MKGCVYVGRKPNWRIWGSEDNYNISPAGRSKRLNDSSADIIAQRLSFEAGL